MNLESHVFISKLVYNEIIKVFPIHINKTIFRAGNVLADYSPLVFTHPHYYTVSWDYIEKYIDRVCSLGSEEDAMEADKLLSFQLGIICHYITDFFCRAHIGSGIGKKREHLQYEDFLDNYRNSIADRLVETDWLGDFQTYESSEDVIGNLRKNVEEYRSLPASPERDITMAIDNCVKTMVSVVAIRLKQAVRKDLRVLHNVPVKAFELPKLNRKELYNLVANKDYQPVLTALQTDKK